MTHDVSRGFPHGLLFSIYSVQPPASMSNVPPRPMQSVGGNCHPPLSSAPYQVALPQGSIRHQTAVVHSPYTFGGPFEFPLEVPLATDVVSNASFATNGYFSQSSSSNATPNLSFNGLSGAVPPACPGEAPARPTAATPCLSERCAPLGQILARHLLEQGCVPSRRRVPGPQPDQLARRTPSPANSDTTSAVSPSPAASPTPGAPSSPAEEPRGARLPFRPELVGRARTASPGQRSVRGPRPDPTQRRHPSEASPRCARSTGSLCGPRDDEDPPAALPATPCRHPKPWKKLRAKRGFKFFMCLACTERWRAPCGARLSSNLQLRDLATESPEAPAPTCASL
eukprot:EG_transcript_13966